VGGGRGDGSYADGSSRSDSGGKERDDDQAECAGIECDLNDNNSSGECTGVGCDLNQGKENDDWGFENEFTLGNYKVQYPCY